MIRKVNPRTGMFKALQLTEALCTPETLYTLRVFLDPKYDSEIRIGYVTPIIKSSKETGPVKAPIGVFFRYHCKNYEVPAGDVLVKDLKSGHLQQLDPAEFERLYYDYGVAEAELAKLGKYIKELWYRQGLQGSAVDQAIFLLQELMIVRNRIDRFPYPIVKASTGYTGQFSQLIDFLEELLKDGFETNYKDNEESKPRGFNPADRVVTGQSGATWACPACNSFTSLQKPCGCSRFQVRLAEEKAKKAVRAVDTVTSTDPYMTETICPSCRCIISRRHPCACAVSIEATKGLPIFIQNNGFFGEISKVDFDTTQRQKYIKQGLGFVPISEAVPEYQDSGNLPGGGTWSREMYKTAEGHDVELSMDFNIVAPITADHPYLTELQRIQIDESTGDFGNYSAEPITTLNPQEEAIVLCEKCRQELEPNHVCPVDWPY